MRRLIWAYTASKCSFYRMQGTNWWTLFPNSSLLARRKSRFNFYFHNSGEGLNEKQNNKNKSVPAYMAAFYCLIYRYNTNSVPLKHLVNRHTDVECGLNVIKNLELAKCCNVLWQYTGLLHPWSSAGINTMNCTLFCNMKMRLEHMVMH